MSKNPQSMKRDSFGDIPPKLLCAHDGRNPRVEASIVADGRDKTPLPYIATIRGGISEGVKLPTEESDRIFYCALVDFFGTDSAGKPKPWEPNPTAYYNYALVCEPMVANKTLLRMTEKQKNEEGREGTAPIFYWKTQRDNVSCVLRPVLNLMMSRRFSKFQLARVQTCVCADVNLQFDPCSIWHEGIAADGLQARIFREATCFLEGREDLATYKLLMCYDPYLCIEVPKYYLCSKDENLSYRSYVYNTWMRTDEVAYDQSQNGENTYWYATMSQEYVPFLKQRSGWDEDFSDDHLWRTYEEVFGEDPNYLSPTWEDTGRCVEDLKGCWIISRSLIGKPPYVSIGETGDWDAMYAAAIAMDPNPKYCTSLEAEIAKRIDNRTMAGIYRTEKGEIAKVVFGDPFCYVYCVEKNDDYYSSLNFACAEKRIVGPLWAGGVVPYKGRNVYIHPTAQANSQLGNDDWYKFAFYDLAYISYQGDEIPQQEKLKLTLVVHYTVGDDPLPEAYSATFKLLHHTVTASAEDLRKYAIKSIDRNAGTGEVIITFNPRELIDSVRKPSPIVIPLTLKTVGDEYGCYYGEFGFEKSTTGALTWEPIEAPTSYMHWDHRPPLGV